MRTPTPTPTAMLRAAAVSVLFTSAALAGDPLIVLWDEATDGELPSMQNSGGLDGIVQTGGGPQPGDAGNWQDLGALPVGGSIVLGTLTTQVIPTGGFIFDGDAVLFTVAEGTLLETITITGQSGVGLREFLAVDPQTNQVLVEFVARTFPETGLGAGPTELVGQFVGSPLGPGSYVISLMNSARFNNTNDYDIEFQVTPAPGAASLALIGLATLTRRRR